MTLLSVHGGSQPPHPRRPSHGRGTSTRPLVCYRESGWANSSCPAEIALRRL